jgi:hypothetical protein
MLEEPPDELDSIECHYLLLVAVGRIAPGGKSLCQYLGRVGKLGYGGARSVAFKTVYLRELACSPTYFLQSLWTNPFSTTAQVKCLA